MITISGKILCAGNLTEDILVWPVDSFEFNRTTWVQDIISSFGGNGSNTTYAIARMGAEVRLAGLVGADVSGDRILEQLAAAGVELRVSRSELPTPVSVVVIRTDGARTFLHRPGASRESFSKPLEFSPELIDGCSHFHLANPFAMPKMRPQAGATLQRAKAAGLTTSLDTGWDALDEWMKVIGPCLPYLDLLFVNEDESERLSGKHDPRESAAFFRSQGTSATVVKLGAKGCFVGDAREGFSVPAFPVQVVDTTGAGDCFAGAFLAGLRRGLSPREAARLANAAGALSVRRPGATTGLLDFEKTQSFMAALPLQPDGVDRNV